MVIIPLNSHLSVLNLKCSQLSQSSTRICLFLFAKLLKNSQTTKIWPSVRCEKVLISGQFRVNKCKCVLRRREGKLQTLRELLYVGSSSFRTPWTTVFEFCHIVTLLHPRVILCPPDGGREGGSDNSTTELLYIIIYNNFKLLLFLFFSIISILLLSLFLLFFSSYSSYFSSIISIFLFLLLSFLSLEPAVLFPPRGSWWGAGGCLELVGASRNNAPMWQCDKVTFLVKSRLSLEAIDGMATDIVR